MKIAVAMSGGVDSSVAALLMKKQGHEVVGFTMHNFKREAFHFEKEEGPEVAIKDAKKVCEKLGIEHHTIYLHQQFERQIIDNFVSEYVNGRTPNPCALCNPKIKWGSFMNEIFKIYQFDKFVTGHYAKIIKENSFYAIYKADDDSKDQTYMLWRLSQNQIKKTLFPLSKYSKKEIRIMAKELGIGMESKKDSQEICFIKDNYKEFLKERITINRGDILFKDGKKIGHHNGHIFYTVGQRRWLNIPWKSPLYVLKKNVKKNQLIVTDDLHDLLTKEFYLKDINWISGSEEDLKNCVIQVRYNSKLNKIKDYEIQKDKIKIIIEEGMISVTAGQSGVIYNRDRLVGGGIIFREE